MEKNEEKYRIYINMGFICHPCNTLATCCEAVNNCCTGGATGVFSCHWLGFIQSLEKMVS